MRPPAPTPATAAPACSWSWRTPIPRSDGRTRRRRTPCSRTSRWPCARRWCRPRAGRFGASASNLRSTRSGPPPVPFAGLVATGVPPRRTPRIPDSRMTFVTWSRPISAGSRPRADGWACVLRYPYTAMKKSAWISRMSRASASCLAAMRLTGLDLNMR